VSDDGIVARREEDGAAERGASSRSSGSCVRPFFFGSERRWQGRRPPIDALPRRQEGIRRLVRRRRGGGHLRRIVGASFEFDNRNHRDDVADR